MKILEFEAEKLLGELGEEGLPVSDGHLAHSIEEVVASIETPGSPVVLMAQIP